MKRLFSVLLVAVMLFTMAGCGSQPAKETGTPQASVQPAESAKPAESAQPAEPEDPSTDKLVIYTTVSDATVEAVVSQFEKQTGVNVELVTNGVGELLKRIESERQNPQGDVLWGAALSSIKAYDENLFYPYVSVNNDAIHPDYRISNGLYTVYGVALRCLLVNTNLAQGIEITGYESLLQDSLKGKISMVDPSASSSGYGHLVNMLYDMGTNNDPESDAAWDYVTRFCEALDGKLLNSSSAVWKGVCDGEYTVGLTYEEVSRQALKDGYPVKIVYCKEGAFGEATTAAIINGAKNLKNAKAFIDYLTSLEVQTMLSNDLFMRGVRTDLDYDEGFVSLDEITMSNADSAYASSRKEEWLAKFQDIWTTVAE